jgi:hypothetical protein
MRSRTIVPISFVLVFAPMMLAATCQPRSLVGQIRQVHSGIRAAFVSADSFVASHFETAGDACITSVEVQGLTGRAAIDASNECMHPWLQLDQAIALSRESLAELENVYRSIESGSSGEQDWVSWARQLLAHGRAIVRILVEINIDGAEPTITEMRTALDQICQLANCEGDR